MESVYNVDTLYTDFLKNRIFVAYRRENAKAVRKVTDFVDRHYIYAADMHGALPKKNFFFIFYYKPRIS
jgi:hypothetical protein